jgi:hypothetical protein
VQLVCRREVDECARGCAETTHQACWVGCETSGGGRARDDGCGVPVHVNNIGLGKIIREEGKAFLDLENWLENLRGAGYDNLPKHHQQRKMQLARVFEGRYPRYCQARSIGPRAARTQLETLVKINWNKADGIAPTVNNKDICQAFGREIQEVDVVLREAHDRSIPSYVDRGRIGDPPGHRCRSCGLDVRHFGSVQIALGEGD